jgi:predicted AlkP superfamily phosphohydrolase/phosphomutase
MKKSMKFRLSKESFGNLPLQRNPSRIQAVVFLAVVVVSLLHSYRHPGDTWAYVGPGAGFAFLGSFLSIVAGFFLTLVSLLAWPFRMVWRMVRRRQGFRDARAHRAIFLGLDGLDPGLTERFMNEGRLPNLSSLRQKGTYRRLRTTFPSLSPVAWSTFATGVNPAKHNIFDFLNRNLKTYIPELSSAHVGRPSRVLKIGKLRIPLSRPPVTMGRKSVPFWKLLGEHNVGCTVIRVPITFPPEPFNNGKLLSAMCTPDLRGTQGSFSYFTTALENATYESGMRYPLRRQGTTVCGELEGPDDPLIEGAGALKVAFQIDFAGGKPRLKIDGQTYPLPPGEYTPWISVKFRASLGISARGIVRFLLRETSPEVSLYATPVEIDPERPALPISHPPHYAVYLAKLFGAYATLGMAEDTWALNEGVIDEAAFLEQAWSIFNEREAQFREALDKTRRGVVACVFDTSDRVQHMFYRYLDGRGGPDSARYAETIQKLYERMDTLVGETLRQLDGDTVLFVLSDHGFCSFRRGINLNTWLLQNGYLFLKEGRAEGGRYFEGVDWARTRAYTLGLGGLYLNVAKRELHGIVRPGKEAEALKRELIGKLTGLPDSATGETSIREVYAASDLYQGPYLEHAPDLIVGYNDGFRTSWDAAVGKVTSEVFEDNEKAWSGDHCVDPAIVPGVLFSNRPFEAENPGIEDMAPTALDLFGVPIPAWMEGKSILAPRIAKSAAA